MPSSVCILTVESESGRINGFRHTSTYVPSSDETDDCLSAGVGLIPIPTPAGRERGERGERERGGERGERERGGGGSSGI